MKEPTYKPEQWITFEQEGAGGFGKIIGGSFDEGWTYTVKGSLANGELCMVHEKEIVYLLQNGSWLAPSHFGGQGSVYSDPENPEA